MDIELQSDPSFRVTGHGASVYSLRSNYLDRKESGQQDEDSRALARLGKKQVLKRNFGFVSMLSFSCTILGTWEGMLIVFVEGFENGGPALMLYQYIVVWIGTLSVFISIGELVSMAPTAGGQYHWVAMLAPKSIKNFLSYVTGWMTILAWIATIATGAVTFTGMTQTLVALNHGYVAAPYQGTLMAWAVILLCIIFNTVISNQLPKVESGFLLIHVFGFFAILIPIMYYAPHPSAEEVFSLYNNTGNWPTQGLSFMVGMLGAAFAFVGADAAVHMSEEIPKASTNIPRSIVCSILLNGALGFGILIAVLFCLGDPTAALGSEYPFIPIFYQAVGSRSAATGMATIIMVQAFSATVGYLATGSRMIWSFARDRALPFSWQLSAVHPRFGIPFWAVIIASLLPVLITLVNLGSTVIFNDVTSLALAGFYSTYFVPLALLLYRRVTGAIAMPYSAATATRQTLSQGKEVQQLTWGPWRVPGWLGIANNLLACCYLLVVWVFNFFPPATPTTPETMTYSSLVFGAVIIFSSVYYAVWARYQYKGPVMEVVPSASLIG